MKETKHSIKSHRYELVHGEDADFIAYQRAYSDGSLADGFNMDDPAYDGRDVVTTVGTVIEQ